MTVVSVHSPSLHHSSSRSALGERNLGDRKQMRYARGLSDQGPRASSAGGGGGGGAHHYNNPPATEGYFAAGYRSVHRFGGNEPPNCSRIDSGYCGSTRRCSSPTKISPSLPGTPPPPSSCRCGNAENMGPRSFGLDPYRIKVVSSPLAIETDPSTLNKVHSQSAPGYSSPLAATARLQTASERELSQHKLHPRFLVKYRVTAELGQGATGFVVAARRIEDGRQVAVKFMYKTRIPVTHWLRDRQLGGTVPLEIFILKRIKHEHIIEFLDCFEDERFFYVVMDGSPFTDPSTTTTIASPIAPTTINPTVMLNPSSAGTANSPSNNPTATTLRQHTTHPVTSPIYRRAGAVLLKQQQSPESLNHHRNNNHTNPRRQSRDLFETIEQNPQMAERDIRHIFLQIARAVQYLHANNIVHRDIKDENIIVTNPETLAVKLIDFGNAAYVPTREQDYFESFHGTLHCAAPEIIRGDPYRGPEQDVWSLGVLLYTLAFGQQPFADARDIEAGRFRTPRVLGRSDELMQVLSMCLTVDVAKRATVEDVLASTWLSDRADPTVQSPGDLDNPEEAAVQLVE